MPGTGQSCGGAHCPGSRSSYWPGEAGPEPLKPQHGGRQLGSCTGSSAAAPDDRCPRKVQHAQRLPKDRPAPDTGPSTGGAPAPHPRPPRWQSDAGPTPLLLPQQAARTQQAALARPAARLLPAPPVAWSGSAWAGRSRAPSTQRWRRCRLRTPAAAVAETWSGWWQ